MSKWKKIAGVLLAAGLLASVFTGCGDSSQASKDGETIVLRILENDTAKKEGYLQELLDAFNEAYKDINKR